MKRLTINIPDDRGTLYQVIKYPAGEIQVRLTPLGIRNVIGAEEYTITANPVPDIMELAQLKSALDGAKSWEWRKLELPYLPYARADRRFVTGDSYGLATFARLLNSLQFDVIDTFDVHSAKSFDWINKLVNLNPITHYDQITPIIKDIGRAGLVLIAPDKGAALRYDLKVYKLPVLVGEKLRDPETGKLSGFRIDPVIVEYGKALIIDDICDGGGTFVGLGEAIKKLNPKIELGLYVSHGIFSQGFYKLNRVFDHIYISDYSFRGGEYDTFKTIGRKR
jgi:ribose-phosphate pyrophosphokinase